MAIKIKSDIINKWIKQELVSFQPFIILIAFFNVLVSVFSLAFAYLVRYLVNSATHKDNKMMVLIASILISLIVLRILVQISSSYLAEKCRIKITTKLRQKIFKEILFSNYSSVEKYHSGDLLTRLTSDVSEVANSTVILLPAVSGMAIQSIGAIIALVTLDWLFTLIFGAGAIITGFVTIFFRKKSKIYHKEIIKADGESRSFIQESISASLTLKAYNAEDKILIKSDALLKNYYFRRMQRNRLLAGFNGLFSLISNAGFIFALIWCGVGIIRGELDYGAMMSIILLLGQLKQPITSFSAIMHLKYARYASAERLYEVTQLSKDSTNLNEEKINYNALQFIEINNLSFSYGEKIVFSNSFARIKKGNVVCVTGDSASGKSTLFKILLNAYKPKDGEIVFVDDNSKYNAVTSTSKFYAYVPQGNFLFSGTLKENITAFYRDNNIETLDRKIIKALEISCSEFVNDLPQGLNTYLGERGIGLSEGQIQRLAIARALISERPILLLDEATSALDEDTERQLLKNLKELNEKTILIVTHRPAALKIADQILHVSQGKIVERAINK